MSGAGMSSCGARGLAQSQVWRSDVLCGEKDRLEAESWGERCSSTIAIHWWYHYYLTVADDL